MNAKHVLGDGGIYVFIRSWDDTNNILMTTSPGNNHCLLIKFVHKILQGEIKLPLDELVCSYSRQQRLGMGDGIPDSFLALALGRLVCKPS